MLNYAKINKEYNKLKMNKSFFHCVDEHVMNGGKYIMNCSQRSTGKTTSYLVYGILGYVKEECPFAYIRQTLDMITPKASATLFDVVISLGLIEKITNGKYNSCVYKYRKWYLCNRDENGHIIEQDENAFCYMLAINKHMDYKSVLNLPNTYIIIFDEFISDMYMYNEFMMFMDLLSTIIRQKENVLIIMLANTIDIHNKYFREFEIYNDIKSMKIGDKKTIKTKKGTIIDFNFIGVKEEIKKAKQIINKLYFGFKNENLSAITGEGSTWSFDLVQHIPPRNEVEYKSMSRDFYLYSIGELYKMEVVQMNKHLAIFVYEWTNEPHENTIIYTNEFVHDVEAEFPNSIVKYNKGDDELSRMIWNEYEKGHFYYSDNTTGAFVESYLNKMI